MRKKRRRRLKKSVKIFFAELIALAGLLTYHHYFQVQASIKPERLFCSEDVYMANYYRINFQYYQIEPDQLLENIKLPGVVWKQSDELSETDCQNYLNIIKDKEYLPFLILNQDVVYLEHLDDPVSVDPEKYIELIWSMENDVPTLRIEDGVNRSKDGEYNIVYRLLRGDEIADLKILKVKVETPTWKKKEREQEEKVQKFLDFAQSQVGKGCSGPLRYFGHDEKWCSEFVSYCAHMTGFVEDEGLFPKYSYCAQGIAFFKSKGNYHVKGDGYIPQPGDVVFFGSGGKSHTGIVKDVKGDVLYTIEGNASGRGDYHTKKAGAKVRRLSSGYVHSFGHPDWTHDLEEETEEKES